MRMIANIIIKMRKDILKFNILLSVRHQKKIRILRRGRKEKGGVVRKERKQNSVMEGPCSRAMRSIILDSTTRWKLRLHSPMTPEAQTSEEGKEKCVEKEYSEKISYFLRDWNFLLDLTAKKINNTT